MSKPEKMRPTGNGVVAEDAMEPKAFSDEDLNNWFSYHAPNPDQLKAYNDIRISARAFADVCNAHLPKSADSTAAMRKIRDAVMAVNLAIACNP